MTKFTYDGNYNFDLCRKCSTQRKTCCEIMPGSYTPKDIFQIFSSVENAIKSELVSIDWWEAENPLYFLRPKAINDNNRLYNPSWGGQCIHLKENGCELHLSKRPTLCKMLTPSKDFECSYKFKQFRNDKHLSSWLWKRTKIDLSKY